MLSPPTKDDVPVQKAMSEYSCSTFLDGLFLTCLLEWGLKNLAVADFSPGLDGASPFYSENNRPLALSGSTEYGGQ